MTAMCAMSDHPVFKELLEYKCNNRKQVVNVFNTFIQFSQGNDTMKNVKHKFVESLHLIIIIASEQMDKELDDPCAYVPLSSNDNISLTWIKEMNEGVEKLTGIKNIKILICEQDTKYLGYNLKPGLISVEEKSYLKSTANVLCPEKERNDLKQQNVQEDDKKVEEIQKENETASDVEKDTNVISSNNSGDYAECGGEIQIVDHNITIETQKKKLENRERSNGTENNGIKTSDQDIIEVEETSNKNVNDIVKEKFNNESKKDEITRQKDIENDSVDIATKSNESNSNNLTTEQGQDIIDLVDSDNIVNTKATIKEKGKIYNASKKDEITGQKVKENDSVHIATKSNETNSNNLTTEQGQDIIDLLDSDVIVISNILTKEKDTIPLNNFDDVVELTIVEDTEESENLQETTKSHNLIGTTKSENSTPKKETTDNKDTTSNLKIDDDDDFLEVLYDGGNSSTSSTPNVRKDNNISIVYSQVDGSNRINQVSDDIEIIYDSPNRQGGGERHNKRSSFSNNNNKFQKRKRY